MACGSAATMTRRVKELHTRLDEVPGPSLKIRQISHGYVEISAKDILSPANREIMRRFGVTESGARRSDRLSAAQMQAIHELGLVTAEAVCGGVGSVNVPNDLVDKLLCLRP
jgi:hypothetical protein